MAVTKTAIVIQGPTAVGKTAISIAVARHFGTAIISADSRQCYKGMAVGTAQPSPAELAEVKHYFINEFPVETALSAADYERLSLTYSEEIFRNNDTVVVCGGTGLYVKAFCEGMDEMPPIDQTINSAVEADYATYGIGWLQQTIKDEDLIFYTQGEIENPARMIRALVFVRSNGKSILTFRTGTKKERPFHIIKVGIELPREILYGRINRRVDEMMTAGLLDEVKKLYPQKHLKNLQTVGYTELFDHFDGKCTLAEAVENIKQHSRNYAKRQETWFKKDKEIHWLRADDTNVVQKIIDLLQNK